MGAEKRRESSPSQRVLRAGTGTLAATGASLQHPSVLQRHPAARVALSEESGPGSPVHPVSRGGSCPAVGRSLGRRDSFCCCRALGLQGWGHGKATSLQKLLPLHDKEKEEVGWGPRVSLKVHPSEPNSSSYL